MDIVVFATLPYLQILLFKTVFKTKIGLPNEIKRKIVPMTLCGISGTRRFESSISEYRPHLLMKKAKNIVGKKYFFRIFEVPLKLEVRQFEPSRT